MLANQLENDGDVTKKNPVDLLAECASGVTFDVSREFVGWLARVNMLYPMAESGACARLALAAYQVPMRHSGRRLPSPANVRSIRVPKCMFMAEMDAFVNAVLSEKTRIRQKDNLVRYCV